MQYLNILSAYSVTPTSHEKISGRRVDSAFARWFGCRHRLVSRPITNGQRTSVACLKCGMRRAFDVESWAPYGAFYAETDEGMRSVRNPIQQL